MGGAFDNIIEGSTADVEVAFKGANDFDSGQDNRTFPASVVTELEALPEVGVGQPAEHAADRLRDRQGRQGHRRQRPAGPGHQPDRRQVAHRQADPHPRQGRATRPGPDQIALDVDTADKGGFDDRRRGQAGDPGSTPVDEGQAHRPGRVRVGWPQRRDHDRLRQPLHAGALLRRPRRLRHGLAQRGPGRLPDRARQGRADRCCPKGVVARTGDAYVKKNKASLDKILGFLQTFLLVFAGDRPVRRDLPDHQHLLDPGRPAQPRARAAARDGRLAQAGQPRRCSLEAIVVGLRRGRRSGWGSATCSRSACAGCSGSSGSTSAGRTSR